jgi:prepilin-type N-terminal cleavage/methylation domain-containing protein/prepilin-type processing-associated H-X9-DG protein
MQRQRAFTLIELLVVIAIIAILAAILFPVFAQARAKARQASCTSNTKQHALGFMMYVQDYDETFPYWSWYNSYGPGGVVNPNHLESIWFNSIYPYIKNTDIYKCPSTNDNSTLRQNNVWGWTTDVTLSGINSALWDKTVSYGMSESLESGDLCGSANVSGCSDASLNKPANTLLVADCNPGLTGGWAPSSDPADPAHHYIISRVAYSNMPANCWANTATCGVAQMDIGDYRPDQSQYASQFDDQARHSQGALVGFADGHAKWMRSRQITFDLFNGGP